MIEFFRGLGIISGYFILCATAALLLRRVIRMPTEVFRKLLHIILLCSLFVWVYAFQTWWISSLAALAFVAIVFPLLSLAEKADGYSKLLTERKSGEIKRSLVLVFVMFAVLNSVCWGWLGQSWLVLACVCAWGFGDAAAALVGKKYGKRYLEGKLIEGRKSIEGTLAMFAVSFVAVLIVVLINASVTWYAGLAIAAVTAAASAVVELYTRHGMDTVTCPFAAMAVLLPLLYLWGVPL
ncbi:MAG: phosphatidate cytidylyltransferase [Clostridiaceae bacterium]|jgi:dolichol kinase|nr:phosphatidate cytidylyltransferase [Clostridiaceae bacterium]